MDYSNIKSVAPNRNLRISIFRFGTLAILRPAIHISYRKKRAKKKNHFIFSHLGMRNSCLFDSTVNFESNKFGNLHKQHSLYSQRTLHDRGNDSLCNSNLRRTVGIEPQNAFYFRNSFSTFTFNILTILSAHVYFSLVLLWRSIKLNYLSAL